MKLARLQQTLGASCCLGRLVSRTLCHGEKKREDTNEKRVKRKEKFAEAEERNAAGGAGGGNRQVSQCLSALKAQMRSFKIAAFPVGVSHAHAPSPQIHR